MANIKEFKTDCKRCRKETLHIQEIRTNGGKTVVKTACVDCGYLQEKHMTIEEALQWLSAKN